MAFRLNGDGVTAPKGFMAASAAAGIKYEGRNDMALVFSEAPCAAAGTYTSNVVKAAPVRWDQKLTASATAVRAIVVNAGIANACTGEEGWNACSVTASAAAASLGIRPGEVLLASTGVIGMQLPLDRMTAAMPRLARGLSEDAEAAEAAARAIMTTDTVPKKAGASIEIGKKAVRIGGMTKGSGMIHPDMCTMLAFLTTDLAIEAALLQQALSEAVRDSFNMISVDGDTSTNDTCLLLANGLAQNPVITSDSDEGYALFCEALSAVCRDLARQMAADGEGADALMEVVVEGAASDEDARKLARSVTSSSLTKAALYGHDANWGRVLCALGYAGVPFDPDRASVSFESAAGTVSVFENGRPVPFDETTASRVLSEKEVRIRCRLSEGGYTAAAWGCDLTHEYVNINADYRS